MIDLRLGRQSLRRRRSNRSLFNAVRWISLAAGTLLTLLALTPQEWVAKLGDRARLLRVYQGYLMALLLLVLVVILIGVKQPFITRLEYIEQSEYLGVPDMAPQGMQARVVGILDRLGESREAKAHIARIAVLTGRSTLNYLNRIVD